MRKYEQIIGITLFMVVLFSIPVSYILKEDVEFSDCENRYLAGKPSFSIEKILSGKFMKDTEAYVNDQFPQKNFSMSCKSDFLRFTGNMEINGVYVAKDDFLIDKWLPEDFDEEQLNENIDTINSFAKKHPTEKMSVMLVPTAGMILEDKLPKNAPMFKQRMALDIARNRLDGLSYIELKSLSISQNTEELYYKTDHHWTTYGAFLAYKDFCEAKGYSIEQDEFNVETVTESFQGSLYSKVLGNCCVDDKIDVYMRKESLPYSVAYNFGKMYKDTVYDMDKVSQKDKYQVFLGGNYPEITIETSNKNSKRLLIIKDSFANAFIPFLLNEYETIHIIDPRYFNGSIEQYMNESQINECLFLYNIKNFCEDDNIRAVFEE